MPSGSPPRAVAQLLFGSDAFFWALKTYLPSQLARLLALRKGVQATAEQWASVIETEESLLPVRPRKQGVLLDLYVPNPAVQLFPLEDISVPTVIINAKDDTMSAFSNAEHAASRVPHAKLVTIETGGHLLLGSERRVEVELRSITGR